MDALATTLLGSELTAYREAVRKLALERILDLLAGAEFSQEFPRVALQRWANNGLLRERWGGPRCAIKGALAAEALGFAGLGGLGLGLIIHSEAVTSILGKYADNEHLLAWHRDAVCGSALGALALTEESGSDLKSVSTRAVQRDGGITVCGSKRFVSPGPNFDFALTLCQVSPDARGVGALTLVALPVRCFKLVTRHSTLGARSLGTSSFSIAGRVDPWAVVGPIGAGAAVSSWGLTHQRLALGAQSLGSADLAIRFAATHLRRTTRGGEQMFGRQALRLRLAELQSELTMARLGLYALALAFDVPSVPAVREVAAAKVTLTRFAEGVHREVLHMLGGTGYLESESALPRLLRDSILARVGAGADEVMWEMVAAGDLGEHPEIYRRVVSCPALDQQSVANAPSGAREDGGSHAFETSV